MKKRIFSILLILAMLFSTVPSFAADTLDPDAINGVEGTENVLAEDQASTMQELGSEFIFNESTGTITGYNGKNPPERLVIPAEIDGVAVKEIGSKAFHYSSYGGKIDTQIKELELPEGLEVIGGWAFQGNLIEKIILPSTIKELKERAFYGNKLTEMVLSSNLQSIGNDAFYNNKLESVTIPDRVKSIGDSAFKENLLVTVILNEGLEKIGIQAFALNNIESLVIPESVTTLAADKKYGVVWRNFVDASLDNKIQRYTKIYNNSTATIENTHGLLNPASVTIKYQDGDGKQIAEPRKLVGKELKKINVIEEETQWGTTKETFEIVDGSNEYLTDYTTTFNKSEVYKHMAALAPNYYGINGSYKFDAAKIAGYRTPVDQTIELDIDNKEIVFVYEFLGNASITLEGEGLSTDQSENSIGIGTDVKLVIAPPYGKKIASFTVNGEDKIKEVKYADLEHTYTFEIQEETNIKVTYQNDEIQYDEELKIEIEKTSVMLGDKNKMEAFYRGTSVDFPNEGITWSLDNDDFAKIDSKTGEVMALKSGTVIITAMLKNRPDIKDTVTLSIEPMNVKVRVEGNDRTIVAPTEVTIDNLDLNEYGISTNFNEPKPIHGIIKALEIAGIDVHDKKNGLDHGKGNNISMIDGLKTYSTSYYDGWMFYVDDQYADEGVDSFHIEDNQSIVVFFSEDYMNGAYSWFGEEKISVNVGGEIRLVLNSSKNDMYTNEVTVGPLADTMILVNNEEYKVNNEIVKTDENGNATLSFNKAGEYHISAEKVDPGTKRRIITRPYCKINVEDLWAAADSSIPEDFTNDLWLSTNFQILKVNDTYTLTSRRVPEIVGSAVSSDVTHPPYTYKIIEGDSIALEETNNSNMEITALKKGTSIIEVGYEEIIVGDKSYGAVSRVNKSYMIVDVVENIDNEISLNTDITTRSYDTIYYDKGDTVDYSFNVAAEGNDSVEVTCNGKMIEGSESAYVVPLENRSNVIGITAIKGEKQEKLYYVIDARKIEINVENLSRTDKGIAVEDEVKVSFKGITPPVYKLATIYNPTIFGSWGSTGTTVKYSNNDLGDIVTYDTHQYDLANHNAMKFKVTEEKKYSFTDGHIDSEWWGKPLGYEKDMSGPGNPDLNAPTTKDVFSTLPNFAIDVQAKVEELEAEDIVDGVIQIPENGDNNYSVAIPADYSGEGITIKIPVENKSKVFLNLSPDKQFPEINVEKGKLFVKIPENVRVTNGDSSKIELITLKTTSDITLENKVKEKIDEGYELNQIHEVFTMGSGERIVFSDYITLRFKDLANKTSAYIEKGQLSIITKYDNDQLGAAANEDIYAYTDENDLIVKTKHFTDFIAFSVTKKTGGGGTTPPPTPSQDYIKLSIDKMTIKKGYVLEEINVAITKNESIWDVTKRTMDKFKIKYQSHFDEKNNSVYIKSIENDGELENGSGSGWMYLVNDKDPRIGATQYKLSGGEEVRWRYTTNYGKDLGIEYSTSKDPGDSTGTKDKDDLKEIKESLNEQYKDTNSIASWALDAIERATTLGFVKGYNGEFNPKDDVTRAEFAKMMVSLLEFGIEDVKASNFSDVKESEWFYSYVNAAYEAGIIKGFEDKFRPNDNITREEMSVIIARALGLKYEEDADIKDLSKVSNWAKSDVGAVIASGLIVGYDGKFEPRNNTTREMAAVVSMRGYDYKNSVKNEDIK